MSYLQNTGERSQTDNIQNGNRQNDLIAKMGQNCLNMTVKSAKIVKNKPPKTKLKKHLFSIIKTTNTVKMFKTVKPCQKCPNCQAVERYQIAIMSKLAKTGKWEDTV